MSGAIETGWQYSHVAADTQVKAGPGILHTIVINGLTTVGDITLYDSLTEVAPIIGVLHLNTATSVSVQPITLTYDLQFSTGLYVGFDGAVAADLTVTFS